ncbi:MAG: hypothetical protein JNL58_16025 [Planctomyces sp.]|nr:hypothetical protein [Planctomyces sp.]
MSHRVIEAPAFRRGLSRALKLVLKSSLPGLLLTTCAPAVVGWQSGPAVGITGNGADGQSRSQSVFTFPPDSPRRIVEGILIAQERDRTPAAKNYLRMLLDRQLSPGELLSLKEEFGVGVFLQLNADQSLQPDASILLKAINDATQKSVPSDERLLQLAAGLGQKGPQEEAAIEELFTAGNRAVVPLLNLDPSSAAGRVGTQILASNVYELRHGLVAALETSDDSTRVRIVRMLGRCGDHEVAFDVISFIHAADSSDELRQVSIAASGRLLGKDVSEWTVQNVADLLTDKSLELLRTAGRRLPKTSSFGDRQSVPSLPQRQAAVERATVLSKKAVQIQPPMILRAQAIQLLADLSLKPVDMTSASVANPPEVVASSQFGEICEIAMLESSSIEISPGVVALLMLVQDRIRTDDSFTIRSETLRHVVNSTDPRVRLFGALVSQHPRVGGNGGRVKQTLSAVAHGATVPEAVVIDADLRTARELAESLKDSGYRALDATTGIDGFELAAGQMNCELILVHANCVSWDLSLTITNLRADARTRMTPIVIYGPESATRSAERLAATIPGVWFISEPLFSIRTVTNPPVTLADQLLLEGVPLPLLFEEERTVLKTLVPDATSNDVANQ